MLQGQAVDCSRGGLKQTLRCLGARELKAANVLTDEQTRAVQYVARTAKAKSEAALDGLQRRGWRPSPGSLLVCRVMTLTEEENEEHFAILSARVD